MASSQTGRPSVNLLRLLPRFREIEADLAALRKLEALSRDEIASLQLDRLNHLWVHAVRHVPYYRRLATEHQLPNEFGDLGEFSETVPVLPKERVRDNPADFLSEEAARGRWHLTGGSTGVPIEVFWSEAAHRRQLRVKYRAESDRGLGVFDRKVFLWGHGASLGPGWRGTLAGWKQPIEDRARSRLRLSAYRLGAEDLEGYLARIERFRPAGLYGYSSAVYLLARAAADAGMAFPHLRLVTLSAEPAHPWMVEEIRSALGAPVMVEYGAVECGVIATSDTEDRLRVRQDHVLVETVERPDSMYDILVTVLHNPSFPLIRYRIEDVTSSALVQPETGFGWLEDVMGRQNDFVWSAQGRLVHPLVIKHAVEHFQAVRRFTAHQDARGLLTLRLEADGRLPRDEIDHMTRRLVDALEGYPVTIETTANLPATPAGKHRWVVSDLATAYGEGPPTTEGSGQ